MQVLVTGATGLIGRVLCEGLLAEGHTVLALARSSGHWLATRFQQPDFRLILGNIQSESFTSDLFRVNSVDVVFNLAVERLRPEESNLSFAATSPYRTNSLGTLNLLQGARSAGVTGWIQSSTMNVYDFENPLYTPVDEAHPVGPKEANGLSMLLAENLCSMFRGTGIDKMLILRYPGVYGLGKSRGIVHKYVRHCLDGYRQPLVAARDRTSDFVYVRDIAAANLQALGRLDALSGQVLNVGSGQATSLPQLAQTIRDLTCSDVEIREVAPEKPRHFYFDIRRARRHLNYLPGSLEAGLKRYISEFEGAQVK